MKKFEVKIQHCELDDVMKALEGKATFESLNTLHNYGIWLVTTEIDDLFETNQWGNYIHEFLNDHIIDQVRDHDPREFEDISDDDVMFIDEYF